MICWKNDCIENPQAGAAMDGDAGASGIGGSPSLPDQPMDAGATSSSGGSCLVSTPPPVSTPGSDDGSFAEPGPLVAGEASGGAGPASSVADVDETASPPTGVTPNEVRPERSSEAGCSVSSLAASRSEHNRAAFACMFLLAWCAFARRRLVKAAKELSASRRRNRIHYPRSIPCDHH
jgi:hypothetical protein